MGRGGHLAVMIDSVRLVDGGNAALRGVQNAKGGGHVGFVTTAVVLTSFVSVPVAPLWLLIHGKDATLAKGTEVTAYVNGDSVLEVLAAPQAQNVLN